MAEDVPNPPGPDAPQNDPAPGQPDPGVPAAPSPATPPAPRRKGRRWLKVLGAFPLLILLLVVFAPTLAGTSLVRNYVARKVGANLNGRLTIDDWSLGWTSGIDVRGVKVYDDHEQFVLGVARVRSPLSLFKAIRGAYDLGDCVIDEPDLVKLDLYADGTTNYDRLLKPSPAPAAPSKAGPHEPGKLPKVSGNITVNRLHGSVTDVRLGQTLHIDPASGASLKIKSFDDPIDDALKLAYRVGDEPAVSTLTLAGTALLARNGQVRPEHLQLAQKIELAQVDLSAVELLLARAGLAVELSGVASTSVPLDVRVDGAKSLSAAGEIKVADLAVGGELLEGNTYETPLLTLSLKLSGADAGDRTTPVKLERFDVTTDRGRLSLAASGDLRRDAADALTAVRNLVVTLQTGQSLPGGGRIADVKLTADLDLGPAFAAPRFAVETCDVALAEAQAEIGAFLPFLEKQGLVFSEGKLTVRGRGTYDGHSVTLDPADPLAVTAEKLTLNKNPARRADENAPAGTHTAGTHTAGTHTAGTHPSAAHAAAQPGRPLLSGETIALTAGGTVDLTPGAAGAKLSALSLTTSSHFAGVSKSEGEFAAFLVPGGGVRGSGALDVSADLKRLNDLARAAAGAQVVVSAPGTGDLTSGLLKGTVRLSRSAAATNPSTDLAADFKIENLSISTPDQSLQNQTATITLKANTPDDPAGVTTVSEAKLVSPFATLTAGAELKRTVRDGPATRPAGLFEMAQKANLHVEADLPKLAAVVNSFAPPPGPRKAATPLTRGPGELPEGAAAAPPPPTSVASMRPSPLRATPVADVAPAPKPPARGGRAAARANRKPKPAPEQPPAPATTRPADVPLPPIVWNKGALVFNVSITRDAAAGATLLRDGELTLTGLDFQRGEAHYASGAPTQPGVQKVTFAAKLNAGDDPKHPDKPAAQGVRGIQVISLAGDTDLGKLEMIEPISVTHLTTAPKAQGAIKLGGKIADVMKLVNALTAHTPAQSPTMLGNYSLYQTAATEGGRVTIRGGARWAKARFLAAGALKGANPFADELIELVNDVGFDTDAKTGTQKLSIKSLKLLAQGKSLEIDVAGGVIDPARRCEFDGLTVTLSPDLAKLWEVVRPMLSPETQEEYKELKVVGAGPHVFTIKGSCPQDKPAAEAFKSMLVDGGLSVDLLDVKGLHVEKADLPLSLRNGVLRIARGDKPAGQDMPRPAVCNNGKLNLGGLAFDFADPKDPHPRLSAPANLKVLQGISINPAFSHNFLGKLVNPAFVDPKEARGLLDLTLVRCDRLPLDELMESTGPQNDGSAEATFSATEIHIGSRGLGMLLSFIHWGNADKDTVEGSIKDARVTVRRGLVQHTMGLSLGKYRLDFDGTMRLADMDYEPLRMKVPGEMLTGVADLREFADFLPDYWTVALHGPVSKLQPDAESSMQALVKQMAAKAPQALLKNLIKPKDSRGKDGPRGDARDGERKTDDPAGALLNALTKPKEKNKDKRDADRN